ncbi:MAG: DUF4037 domain-containing protein [Chloroflexales bacterium]|nr:DUF4037 domain-containing protein [Chloroflexales bacterium]
MSFVPGLELCRRFYLEAVRPILAAHFPRLPYAAARIGPGSEVLGFDTPMSMDHDWRPHLQLFLRDTDAHLASVMREILGRELPPAFAGFPVRLSEPGHQRDESATMGRSSVPRHEAVWLTTCRAFCWDHLRYESDAPLSAVDWLTVPSQRLLEVTAGAVYHDDAGELTALRARLVYYPRDVWLYLLAAVWTRIGQEEHLMPRAGYVGDELGSALIGSRLVRDVMSLCFLIERRYAPYPKWFGSAFQQLACAAELLPLLWRAQQASTWQEREAALADAYRVIARMQNALGLTPPLPEMVSPFHDRPFRVIHGERFAEALQAHISSEEVRQLAAGRLIGGIDQWCDSTDLRVDISLRPALRAVYRGASEAKP